MATARRLLVLLALVVVAFVGAGCRYGPIRLTHGERGPLARENLARFAYNQGVEAWYRGEQHAARAWDDLAREIAPLPEEARGFDGASLEPTAGGPRFLPYTAEPGLPERRYRRGWQARLLLYPVWGLPFDLVELPLKGILATPGLGHVLVGAAAAPPVIGIVGGVLICDGPLFLAGLAALAAEAATFVVLNGLPAMVYPQRFEDRFEAWADCLEWWYEGRSQDRLAKAFFPNARRIYDEDRRVRRLRRAMLAARERPVDWANREVEEWNAALDAGANPFQLRGSGESE